MCAFGAGPYDKLELLGQRLLELLYFSGRELLERKLENLRTSKFEPEWRIFLGKSSARIMESTCVANNLKLFFLEAHGNKLHAHPSWYTRLR